MGKEHAVEVCSQQFADTTARKRCSTSRAENEYENESEDVGRSIVFSSVPLRPAFRLLRLILSSLYFGLQDV